MIPIEIGTSKRPHQFGRSRQMTQRIKRKKAHERVKFINDVDFLYKFKDVLAEHIQDILIDTSSPPYAGSPDIEWSSLECPKCRIEMMESEDFVHHILSCLYRKFNAGWYQKYDLIPNYAEKTLTEACELRASKSFLAVNFANNTDMCCKVAINSPLAPFLGRGLLVFVDKIPSDLAGVIPGNLEFAGKTYELFFSSRLIEKQVEEVNKIKRNHARRRHDRALRRMCTKFTAVFDDIVLNEKSRTREQTHLLARALNLPRTVRVNQAAILEAIEEIKKARREPSSDGSPDLEDNKGLANEEKRLDSDFTSEFLKPASAKRVSIQVRTSIGKPS